MNSASADKLEQNEKESMDVSFSKSSISMSMTLYNYQMTSFNAILKLHLVALGLVHSCVVVTLRAFSSAQNVRG